MQRMMMWTYMMEAISARDEIGLRMMAQTEKRTIQLSLAAGMKEIGNLKLISYVPFLTLIPPLSKLTRTLQEVYAILFNPNIPRREACATWVHTLR